MRSFKKKKEIDKGIKRVEERLPLKGLLDWLTLSTGILYGELDERLDFRIALQKALKKPVPRHINFWFCFGGITFFLFLLQIGTGIMLLMYYQPTIERAYESVVHITNNVPYGWLMRGLHHWAANIITVTIFIHMLRVYFHAAYKPPRDLTWVSGTFLLILILVFGFTGYLLPWNQVSYWATTVGTEIPGAVPVIGDTLKFLARGGSEIGQLTLTRFFAFHVIILPALVIFMLALHFLMIRRLGISERL